MGKGGACGRKEEAEGKASILRELGSSGREGEYLMQVIRLMEPIGWKG